jgi:coenzyme F420-reducing hydrogenase gamma subunit
MTEARSGSRQGKKPRIGIFKYSCCAGCEFQLIYFQKHILETLGAVDIAYCRMLQSGGSEEGPFDVALIEGAITEEWQAAQLKRVREVSRYLIPIGSCAVCGGIPAIKNTSRKSDIEKRVYTDRSVIHSVEAKPISHYVEVDGAVKGCPMGERDLTELVTSLLLGKQPDFLEHCVCVECKLKGTICVLAAYGEPCMGPVTAAGCGALCPSRERPCYSCWGPMKDANAKALADQFEEMGLSREDIFRKFTEFGEPTEEFRLGKKPRMNTDKHG